MASGIEIKRLRLIPKKPISAEILAKWIGVKPERLRKWEQRDADPKDSGDIQKVEVYFNCKLEELSKLDTFQFYDPRQKKEISTDIQSMADELLNLKAMNRILTGEVAKLIATGSKGKINEETALQQMYRSSRLEKIKLAESEWPFSSVS